MNEESPFDKNVKDELRTYYAGMALLVAPKNLTRLGVVKWAFEIAEMCMREDERRRGTIAG